GDDAILLFVEPAKGTDIALATLKLYESSTSDNTDDIDAYSLLFTHKLDKDNTIGANYTRVQAGKLDGTGNIAVYRIPGATGSYRNASIGLSNVGLFGKGKVAGFGYKATVDLQFGKIKEITGLTMTEQKFSGYGITAGGDYKVDPVTLRANFVYGSGDSDATDTAGNTKNKAFQTFVGNVVDPNLPTVVYNWRVETAAGSGLRGTGIANTTAYNIGLTYPATKDLTLALDYYLLRASKALSTTVDTLGYSKKIGSEVDLKVAYKIAKNLTYGINSGVLFACDYYKRAAIGVTSDPKNAFVLQHGLTLSF
ncbi:MAG: hypothetical protein HZC12_05385, partial [Nitrospirae bacterium]|nr:hypothetical protein [Nitrospirota bacterium]